MTEEEAVKIATAFVSSRWGRRPELIGARAPSKHAPGWTVLYKAELPGGNPEEVVDGPAVVVVDETTREARFIPSL